MTNKITDNLSKPLYMLDNEDDPHGSSMKGIYPTTTIDDVFDPTSTSQKNLRTIIEELKRMILDGGIGNIVFPVTSVNGQQGEVEITLKTLGLDKIDLTADKDKPLSDPQRSAIMKILENYDFDSDVEDDLKKHLQDSNNPHKVTFDQINVDNVVDELISKYLTRHNNSISEDTHRDIRNRLSSIENAEQEHKQVVSDRIDGLYKRMVAHSIDKGAHSDLFDQKEDVKNKARNMLSYDNTTYPTTRAVAEYVISKVNEVKQSINLVDSWIDDIQVVENRSSLPKPSSKFYRKAYFIVYGNDHKQEIAICRKIGGDSKTASDPQSWITKDGSPITEEKIQALLDALDDDYNDDSMYNGSVPYPEIDAGTSGDESTEQDTSGDTVYEKGHNKFSYNPLTGELAFTYDEADGEPIFNITESGNLQVTYDEYDSIADTFENLYFAINNDDITLILNESTEQYYWDIQTLGAYTVFDPKYFYNGVDGLTLNEQNVGAIMTEMAGQYNSYENGANKFYYNKDTGELTFVYDEADGECEMHLDDNGNVIATYEEDDPIAETLDKLSFSIKTDSLLLKVQDSNPLTDLIEDMFNNQSALLLSDYYTKSEIDKQHYISSIKIVTGTQDGMIRYYINDDQTTMSEDIPVAGLGKLAFLDKVTENEIATNAIGSENIANKAIEDRHIVSESIGSDKLKASFNTLFANINDSDGKHVDEVPIDEFAQLIRPQIQEIVDENLNTAADYVYDQIKDRIEQLVRDTVEDERIMDPENAWTYNPDSGIIQFTFNEANGTPTFNINSNGELEASYNEGDRIGSILNRSSFSILNDELLLNVS